MEAASKRYIDQYKDANQEFWLNKSKSIIQHISKELKDKYIYFPDLLQYLAGERRQLAEILKDEKAKRFGSFCTEHMVGSEAILNDIVNREEVVPIVENLLKQGEVTEYGVRLTFKNPFKHLFPESDHKNKREKAIWASDVLHKNNFGRGSTCHTLLDDYEYGYNNDLSKIFKNKDGHIGLKYRNYNKYNLVGDYFAAQALYDDLLNWNPKNDIDLFMASAAQFSYLMTHGFFVRRGMASITEWIIRDIASHHGLQLGGFHEDALGWPWRALTTPNLEEYVTWFKKNSYIIKSSKENIYQSTFDYPTSKLTIIGGGIVGFLEAYYAYLDAKRKGERIRVTIHEKHPTMKGTTTAHLIPNLTPYEILSVVPRGQDLINKLSYLFSEQEGIRVDDVVGANDSIAANEFIRAVQEYGQNEEGHRARTETLLALGKMSMDLWQEIYTNADAELKAILIASNFNPCRELTNHEVQILHDGYRIDLIYRVPNAANKANVTISDYTRLGYTDCKTLSPEEAMRLDPFLTDFCVQNSEISEDGTRIWHNDAIAYWRPGGCLDTQVFLPLFHDYLKRVMGQYTNQEGIPKDCFQLRLQRQVEQVAYEPEIGKGSINKLNGLKFFGNPSIKYNKHAYQQSDYIFCPGEAVGTLKSLGFTEPEYARFAGVSIMLRINIPPDKLEAYSTLSHHMSVCQNGVSSAWQARCIGNQIFIGLAGTKAFYADQVPHKNQAFAKNRNLVQLNMINDVVPEFISLALGRPTHGVQLTEADMEQLELHHIAERWAGSRAVAYDGFPTIGHVYNHNGQVSNARCTTHLGSGGASFSPAAVLVSRSSMFASEVPQSIKEKVLVYGSSQRMGLLK